MKTHFGFNLCNRQIAELQEVLPKALLKSLCTGLDGRVFLSAAFRLQSTSVVEGLEHEIPFGQELWEGDCHKPCQVSQGYTFSLSIGGHVRPLKFL